MHKSPSFNPQFHHEVAAQAKLDKPLVFFGRAALAVGCPICQATAVTPSKQDRTQMTFGDHRKVIRLIR